MPTKIIKPGRPGYIDRSAPDAMPVRYVAAVLIPILGVILAVRRFYFDDISNGLGLLVTSALGYALWALVVVLLNGA